MKMHSAESKLAIGPSNIPFVGHFSNFIEGIIPRECGINVKLHLTDIMSGVQRSNIQENIMKKKLTTLFQ